MDQIWESTCGPRKSPGLWILEQKAIIFGQLLWITLYVNTEVIPITMYVNSIHLHGIEQKFWPHGFGHWFVNFWNQCPIRILWFSKTKSFYFPKSQHLWYQKSCLNAGVETVLGCQKWRKQDLSLQAFWDFKPYFFKLLSWICH